MLEFGESLLTQFFDALPDHMFLLRCETDGGFRLVACNQAMCRFLGLEQAAILNCRVEDIITQPDAAERLIGNYQRVVDTGQSVRYEESACDMNLPGHVFDTTLSPLFDAEGRCQYICGISRDISLRKNAENALRNSNAQLELRVLETRALQEQVRQQAMRDPLTGLYNRRYMEETLTRELFRARRAGYPLTLLMIDVDHFKAVNDEHGHQVGDTVLQAVALHLMDNMRSADIVCRYGGEEFLVLLPDMTVERALRRVEDWRHRVGQMSVQHGTQTLKVSFSAGLAEFPGDAATPAELIHAADQALYQAKKSGRDRVCVYAPA